MNIQDYKIGDIAVFRDGTEAKIVKYKHKVNGQCLLWFERKITEWLAGYIDHYWFYYKNGNVDTLHLDVNEICKLERS